MAVMVGYIDLRHAFLLQHSAYFDILARKTISDRSIDLKDLKLAHWSFSMSYGGGINGITIDDEDTGKVFRGLHA